MCDGSADRERKQLQAVRDILKVQPAAQVGISYFATGQGRWAGIDFVKETFRSGAVACPVTTAKDPRNRVCAGCRNCWAASRDRLVIFVNAR